MLECIFTIDYEIYGNGYGSLRDLVFEPTEKLRAVFDRANAKFVVFVEAIEFSKIEAFGTDSGIEDVKRQIRHLHREGFEIGLHLHPQWYNARLDGSRWVLDYSDYNLCLLERVKIKEIVQQGLNFLRRVTEDEAFVPFCFRAGNWLFQPSSTAAAVLAQGGVKIDSSVFRGGLLHEYQVDYRGAPGKPAYWLFKDDAAVPDSDGIMLEIPIYTRMAPFWKMATGKRLRLQSKGNAGPRSLGQRWYRFLNLLRFLQPMKFDFCRMTCEELESIIRRAMTEDLQDPSTLKPMVAIGHSKDLEDLQTIERFLAFLHSEGIKVTTFRDVYARCFKDALRKSEKAKLLVP